MALIWSILSVSFVTSMLSVFLLSLTTRRVQFALVRSRLCTNMYTHKAHADENILHMLRQAHKHPSLRSPYYNTLWWMYLSPSWHSNSLVHSQPGLCVLFSCLVFILNYRSLCPLPWTMCCCQCGKQYSKCKFIDGDHFSENLPFKFHCLQGLTCSAVENKRHLFRGSEIFQAAVFLTTKPRPLYCTENYTPQDYSVW